MASNDVYAILEISIGPLGGARDIGDHPAIADLFERLLQIVHGEPLPERADPSGSMMLRTVDELGLDEHTDNCTIEEVYARLGHYVSTYCIDGIHDSCRYWCKHCHGECRCHCHAGQPPLMCSTVGHEQERAVGTTDLVDEATSAPFCQECLDRLIAYGPDSARQRQVRTVAEAFLRKRSELEGLHHAHMRLDANAAYFLAEVALDALSP